MRGFVLLKGVKNGEEVAKFRSILNKGWKENNWIQQNINCEDFIFIDNDDVVGTLSILKYNPQKQSFVNDVFEFNKVEPIKSNIQNTIEIDNFTIVKPKRGLKTLLSCANKTAPYIFSREDILYCIAIVKPQFYRTIKFMFGDCVQSLNDPVYCERDDCHFIPIYFDVKKTKKKLGWLLGIHKKSKFY